MCCPKTVHTPVQPNGAWWREHHPARDQGRHWPPWGEHPNEWLSMPSSMWKNLFPKQHHLQPKHSICVLSPHQTSLALNSFEKRKKCWACPRLQHYCSTVKDTVGGGCLNFSDRQILIGSRQTDRLPQGTDNEFHFLPALPAAEWGWFCSMWAKFPLL